MNFSIFSIPHKRAKMSKKAFLATTRRAITHERKKESQIASTNPFFLSSASFRAGAKPRNEA